MKITKVPVSRILFGNVNLKIYEVILVAQKVTVNISFYIFGASIYDKIDFLKGSKVTTLI